MVTDLLDLKLIEVPERVELLLDNYVNLRLDYVIRSPKDLIKQED